MNKESASSESPEKVRAADRIFPVSVSPVKTQDVIYSIEATCSMFAEYDTDVRAEVDGRVQKILFEEGDFVAEGDTLIWLDDERYQLIVNESLAKLKLARANLKNISRLFNRNRKLFRDGVISSQEYDNINNQIQAAIANVEQAKASLRLAHKDLKDTKIKAPINGVISSKSVDLGEYVKKEEILLNIVMFDPIKVKLYFPEKFAPQITEGKTIYVTLEAFPEETFEGTIYFVNPKIIIETRRVECFARIPNKEFKLKPGFFGIAKAVAAVHKSSPVIPEESILSENGETYCYLAEGDHVKRVSVITGWRLEGGLVEILKGIKPEDMIVYRGQHVINDGDRIKIITKSP